jgi:hypothetical protein
MSNPEVEGMDSRELTKLVDWGQLAISTVYW